MLISAEERVANDGGDELIMGVCFRFQWHRTATTQETDGFQVKRPGDVSVRCTLLLMLDYQVSAAVFTPVWGRCDPLPDTVAWPCAAPPV